MQYQQPLQVKQQQPLSLLYFTLILLILSIFGSANLFASKIALAQPNQSINKINNNSKSKINPDQLLNAQLNYQKAQDYYDAMYKQFKKAQSELTIAQDQLLKSQQNLQDRQLKVNHAQQVLNIANNSLQNAAVNVDETWQQTHSTNK